LDQIKKCCVSASVVKKGRWVGNKLIFFFNFISNSSEYIANSSTIMRVFIELNNGFIPCIHRTFECTHAELPISLHWLQVQRYALYLDFFYFFLRVSIKFLGWEVLGTKH
jgi:hypothetical protein